MNKYKVLVLLAICLLVCLPSVGCNSNREGYTATASVKQPSGEVNGQTVEFGMYPAVYTIAGYQTGATVEMPFTLYNDLPYSTVASVYVVLPIEQQLAKNKGYVAWGDVTAYCQVVDADLTVPANGSKTVMVRLYVPNEVSNMPDKYMFYIAYRSKGHLWGSYAMTQGNNFVFYPYCFEANISDTSQQFTWLTWGNNPRVIIRANYGTPPDSPSNGELIYEGYGEQVIRKWTDPDTGKVLDRQYTLYTISDNKYMSWGSGEKIFYKAWQEHLVKGVWDGTWDAIGQSMVVPGVDAKVLVGN